MPRYEVKCRRCQAGGEITMSFREFDDRVIPPERTRLQLGHIRAVPCPTCAVVALSLVPSAFTFSI
jgi:hypothetical protein